MPGDFYHTESDKRVHVNKILIYLSVPSNCIIIPNIFLLNSDSWEIYGCLYGNFPLIHGRPLAHELRFSYTLLDGLMST